MNSFPFGPNIVFVCHPTNDEDGFLMYYVDCENVNRNMFYKYGKQCYEQEMKPTIFEELKKYKIKPMTKNEWKQLPKPKPFMAIY